MINFILKIRAEDTDQLKEAYCVFQQEKDSGVSGYVIYKQASSDSSLMMHVELQGLTPNQKHGFHIHEKGDLTEGCSSQGSHYNPTNQNHGGLTDIVRHKGDLGNIQADSNGNVSVDIVASGTSLFGDYSIMGRGCSVHSGEDDLGKGGDAGSIKSGNSGSPVACGEIKEGHYENLLIFSSKILAIALLIIW